MTPGQQPPPALTPRQERVVERLRAQIGEGPAEWFTAACELLAQEPQPRAVTKIPVSSMPCRGCSSLMRAARLMVQYSVLISPERLQADRANDDDTGCPAGSCIEVRE